MRSRPALLLCLCLLLTGCALPHERSGDATSKVAARPGQLAGLLEVYNEARRRGAETRDTSVLRRVETGALLDIDAGAYFVGARVRATEPLPPVRLAHLREVVTPRFTRYPMWAGALVDDVASGTQRFVVFERESSVAPWLMTAAPELAGSGRVPRVRTGAGGAAVPVDPGDAAGLAMAPQEAVDAYVRALSDPSAVEQRLFAADEFLRDNTRFREAQQALPFASFEQTWAARPVRYCVRLAGGGALVVATLTRIDRYRVQPGSFIDWSDNAAAKAYLPGRAFTSARLTFRHQVLLLVPGADAQRKARLLGQYGGVVDGQGS